MSKPDLPQKPDADQQRALDEDFENDLAECGPEALDSMLTGILRLHLNLPERTDR